MKQLLFTLVAVIVVTVPAAAAADFQVVANPGVRASALAADDLKEIFLGVKNTLPDGSAVEPVLGGGAHDAFLKALIGKSDQALRNYFKTLVFTGKGSMPKSFATDAEVLRYIAATKGAIGYVSVSADTAGVKKVAVR